MKKPMLDVSTDGLWRCPFLERPWMGRTGAASGTPQNTGLKGIVAGGVTGATEICITYPTEYVKTQLQLDGTKGDGKMYDGAFDVVRKTIRTNGITGLYRGLSVLLAGTVPKVAIRFGSFERAKTFFIDSKTGVLSPTNRALCGLIAGISEAIFAVTPMETVKVKFIHDRRSPTPRYKGLFHGIATIIKEEGFRGVYRGVVPTIIKQGSNQMVRFFIMESLKEEYRRAYEGVSAPKYVIGMFGVVAGAASVFVNNPLDVVKTRMQGLKAAQYSGTLDCLVKLYKKDGPMVFYKGTMPRLARVCLDVAITFMVYESLMDVINKVFP